MTFSSSFSNPIPFFLNFFLLIFILFFTDKCNATFSLPAIHPVQLEGFNFTPYFTPPTSNSPLFLAGTGVNDIEVNGKTIKKSSCAIYLEPKCIAFLGHKWRNKNYVDIKQSLQFFTDVATGPFQKYCWVRILKPIKGEDYAKMVSQNSMDYLNNAKQYGEKEKAALSKFRDAFKGRYLGAGSSVLVSHTISNFTLTLSKKNSKTSKEELKTFDSREVGEAILMSTISSHSTLRDSLGKCIFDIFRQSSSFL